MTDKIWKKIVEKENEGKIRRATKRIGRGKIKGWRCVQLKGKTEFGILCVRMIWCPSRFVKQESVIRLHEKIYIFLKLGFFVKTSVYSIQINEFRFE